MIARRLEFDEAISIHDTETALLAGSCDRMNMRSAQGLRKVCFCCCLRQVWCFLQM